jgi:cell fate regulator YaaT (PSP1 superfamily)
MSGFKSVSTNSARVQQLSLNPQKLAGQCGKLKCCLNYEIDNYLDTLRDFPDAKTRIKTRKGEAYHQKSDVFRKIMWYAYTNDSNNMMALTIDKVKEIINMNRKGKLPADLESYATKKEVKSDIDSAGNDDFGLVI